MPRFLRTAAALLALALVANLAVAGEIADAAKKELLTELEACEKLLNSVPTLANPKGKNGIAELNNWTKAAEEIKDKGYGIPWYDALMEHDKGRVNSAETIRDALDRTKHLTPLMEKAAKADFFAIEKTADDQLGVQFRFIPVVEATKFACGRVRLLDVSGRGDEARAEMKSLIRVVARVPAYVLAVQTHFAAAIRSSIMVDHLCALAGKNGWDASFLREIYESTPLFKNRPSDLIRGELTFQCAGLREVLSAKEQSGLETAKELVSRSRIDEAEDPEAEAAQVLTEKRVTLRSLRTLVDGDLVQAIDLSTEAGLKQLQTCADELREVGAQKKDISGTLLYVILPLLVEGRWRAAVELRLLELETGPLCKRREEAQALVSRHIGLSLEWDGEDAVLKFDKNHHAVKVQADLQSVKEIRLRPAGK